MDPGVVRSVLSAEAISLLLGNVMFPGSPETISFMENTSLDDLVYVLGDDLTELYLNSLAHNNFAFFVDGLRILDILPVRDNFIRINAVLDRTSTLMTLLCQLETNGADYKYKLLHYALA